MTTVPAAGWAELLQRLLPLKGSVLFIGRSDSGKSTLVRYLVTEVAAAGIAVAQVDADVGQSSLGLPGTVTRRTFRAPPLPHQMRWDELSFLGSVTPVPIISLLAAETGRLVLRARQDAALVLIDSTGLVEGELGVALKLAKIRAVAPELVVAVTAGDELEPILSRLGSIEVVRLAPSPMVKRRSPVVRIRHRHARLAGYLQKAAERLFSTRRLTFIHRGRPIHPYLMPPEVGTVVGLNHNAETRAVGVIAEADSDSLVVLTPLGSPRGIDRIIVGDFTFSCERENPLGVSHSLPLDRGGEGMGGGEARSPSPSPSHQGRGAQSEDSAKQ